MASTSPMAAILLTLIPCLFLAIPQVESQAAPALNSSNTVNLTAILEKGGGYTILIRLLASTGVETQIENQLNNSNQGLTLFAPTDNAINSLKPGTINSLSQQQQTELVLYHLLPQYYSLGSLQTVSNPVRTEASSQNGVDTLNFTLGNNQLNVSSGIVSTPVYIALRQQFPLGVYQSDKVLLPESLFGTNSAPAPAPEPAMATSPSATPADSTGGQPVAAPSSESNGRNVGLGLVAGIGLVCMGVLLQ